MNTIQQLTGQIEDTFRSRFSPKYCSPERRLQVMFDAGQQISSEHKAKTRAGMLRKTHPRWAAALLDGFYSRPDSPPSPTHSIVMRPPSPAQPVSAIAAATADVEAIIEKLENTTMKALAHDIALIAATATGQSMRRINRHIQRAELSSYMAMLGDFFTMIDGAEGDQDKITQIKYAVMQNYLAIAKLDVWVFKSIVPIIFPEPRYQEYIAAVERLADTWANKDETGKVVMQPEDNGPNQQRRDFTMDAQASHDSGLTELRLNYADAITRHDEQTAQANELWLKMIEVDIFCIPYGWITEYVDGITAIMFMVYDAPCPDWPSPNDDWDLFKDQGGALNLFVSR